MRYPKFSILHFYNNRLSKGGNAFLKLPQTHTRFITPFTQKNSQKWVYKETTNTFFHNTFKT